MHLWARFCLEIRPQCQPRWRFPKQTVWLDLAAQKAWDVPLQQNYCLLFPSSCVTLWKLVQEDGIMYKIMIAAKRERQAS